MHIAFRTEGNHQQGMGDVWGSVALADEFARMGDDTRFFLSGGEEACTLLAQRGHKAVLAETLDAEVAALQTYRPDVMVVNKLKNDPVYLQTVKGYCRMLVTVDDDGNGAQYADLNVNVLYPIPGSVAGPQYITLRDEFQTLRRQPRMIKSEVGEILVTQGGSDTYGFTPKIVRGLKQFPGRPHVTVVVGPAFRHEPELRKAMASCSFPLTLVRNARNMGELMVQADMAVTAGGLTMFELACVGTPALVVCGERFEVRTAARLSHEGVVVNLGFGGDVAEAEIVHASEALARDRATRESMSSRGQALVDGRGAVRVATLIKERWARDEVVRA